MPSNGGSPPSSNCWLILEAIVVTWGKNDRLKSVRRANFLQHNLLFMDLHSVSPSTPQQEQQYRNWLDLPKDVASSIFLRLGAIEILTSVQGVCTTWRTICGDPSMWREIDIFDLIDNRGLENSIVRLSKNAVDRSCGGLLKINIEYFGNDDLLQYIADRSPNLKALRIVICYSISDEGFTEAISKLPLLEVLEIYYGNLSKEFLNAAGKYCSHLKSLSYCMEGYKVPHIECDEEALVIAKKMPNLRHLQLFGNKLTNEGLRAILKGCQHLESLDLRQCFNVKLEGDLKRICAERIRDLRCPNDPTDDYPFDATIQDMDYFDGDNPWFSDVDEEYDGFSDLDFLSDDDDFEFPGEF